jgi:hypothetical protein
MPLAATLILAALGILCVVLGYRLFCGLPVMRGNYPASRSTALLLNILPGAILALFGAGLFTAEARTLVNRHPAIQRHIPATQQTGWPHSPTHIPSRAA